MILVVPTRRAQYGIPTAPQTLVRRYFEERFRRSEMVEVMFSSRSRCYVRVTQVCPCTTPDGRPSSEYIERGTWYDIIQGWGTQVMEVPG